jgi:hypothetical protein
LVAAHQAAEEKIMTDAETAPAITVPNPGIAERQHIVMQINATDESMAAERHFIK